MTRPTPGTDTDRATRSSRRAGLGLIVALMTVMVAPPVVQVVLEVVAGDGVRALDLFRLPPTEENLRAFEDELAEGSWLTGWARRWWAPAVDAAIQRGGSKVVFGRSGWLFYRRGVEFVAGAAYGDERARRLLGLERSADAEAAWGDPVDAIVDYRDRLAERGVELVFVPVPVKPTLYPERLWRDADGSGLPDNPEVERTLSRLREAGVEVVDPTPDLLAAKLEGEEVFLPLDTHWSPAGARRVAERVARRLRSLPAVAAALGEPVPFDGRHIRVAGRGDVYDMLAYSDAGRLFDRREVEIFQVAMTATGDPPRDLSSPVLVLGDSLSAVFSDPALGLGRRAGFPELLAAELGSPVDWIAMPGGGAAQARRTLQLRPGGLEGKAVVVWQVSRRDLLFSSDGWPRVALPPEAAVERVAEDDGYRVLGWVAEVSRWPGPLDYRDCLAIVRYRLIEGELPGEGDEFFVAHWGWRNFRRTPIATLRPRTVHELVLRRMPPEHSLESTCWIDSVGLDREPWWPESYEVR